MVGSKYDDRTREEALAMLATGMRVVDVSEIMKIPKQTISDWKCNAEERDEDFRAARNMEKRRVVAVAWKIYRDAFGIVRNQVKAAKKSRDEVDKICQAILLSGADEGTVKTMERIVREHYGMSTRDVLSVMSAVHEHGESLRRSMTETGDGQTMLVEFGAGSEWAE